MSYRSACLLVGIVYWSLLFFPKFNFISFSGESAGLRLDDIIILLSTPYLLLILKRGRITLAPMKMIWIYIATAIVFTGINQTLFQKGSILYPIRYLEYSLFGLAGLIARDSLRFNMTAAVKTLVSVNFIVILLQAAGALGGFSSEGYAPDVSDRPIGLTGGPWEIGVLMAFSAAYILSSSCGRREKAFWYGMAFVSTMMTGSRMSLLGIIFVLGANFISQSKNPIRSTWIASLSVATLLLIAVAIPNPVTERSAGLFTAENIDRFLEASENADTGASFDGFPEYSYQDEDGDISWLMRVSKWTIVLSIYKSNSLSWLIGLGHGLWGPALDGGFLRITTEGGIIGMILFSCGLLALSNHAMGRMMLIVFTINLLMIDVHLSSRIMGMMYFMLAYACIRNPRTCTTAPPIARHSHDQNLPPVSLRFSK